MEECFCIIKPDALERGIVGEIITRIERMYFRISYMQLRHKNKEWCSKHYEHVINASFFPDLLVFMTTSPILGFTISGPNAHGRLRTLVGNTVPYFALPGTIRGDYGSYPPMYNCIHIAENQVASNYEFSLFTDHKTDFILKEPTCP